MARSRNAGKKIDFTQWTLGSATAFSIDGTPGTGAVNVLSAGTSPATIMRIRGSFDIWLDVATAIAVGDLIRWAAGMIVMPEGQGTTVVSSPIADGNASWLWYATGILTSELASTWDPAEGGMYHREVVDSKAMRVIRPDREVQFVVEGVDISGTSVLNCHLNARFLLGI